MCAPCLHRECTASPFPGLRIGITKVQLMFMGRGTQLHLWEGEVSKTVDICILEPPKQLINIWGELPLRLCNYPVFSLNVCPLTVTVTGGWCLQQLLLWCSSDTFYFSHCLTEILLYRRAFPFLLFIYLYGFMGVYSLVFNPIL